MAFDSLQHDDIQTLQKQLAQVEKERDALKRLSADNAQRLHAMAGGKSVGFFWNMIQRSCQGMLPGSYGLILTRKKGEQEWLLAYQDETNESLVTPQNNLGALPRALVTFADSPSCPKRREEDIQTSSDWRVWRHFLESNHFHHAVMLNVLTKEHDDYMVVFFQPAQPDYDDSIMGFFYDDAANWVKAASIREFSDRLLFEDGHRDPKTGLLRRYSFEKNFSMVLKDSRRHFQRVALIHVKLRRPLDNDNDDELKRLADSIHGAIRDNDLVAYYGEGEFVMGIRIRHMEDAEVVVNKILKALRAPDTNVQTLASEGVCVGVSFYPEHSSLEDLYTGAVLASNSVTADFGYRVEFHGSVYVSCAEFYSF